MSPYCYDQRSEPYVLNVGWLDSSQLFCTGTTTSEFRDKLKILCQNPILLHRGFHVCQFCRKATGNGQIRVANSYNNRIYAAPALIHHYVVAHHYLPPDEFVHAVVDINFCRDF